jgi:site-specific DNA-cytosine methylase
VKVLTLFAGAGGADIGLEAAGFDHVLGVEWDEDAAETSRLAGFPVVTGDVRDLSMYEGLGPIDSLWSSFPCQDFSSAGSRKGAKGERNGWPWTLDVVDLVKPTWLMAENVTGLVQHRGDIEHSPSFAGRGEAPAEDPESCPGCYFIECILPSLEERFDFVDWRIVDAADHGVPQRRRRVIIVAGPGPVEWPEATHSGEALAKAKWVTGKYWRDVARDPAVLQDDSLNPPTSADLPSPSIRGSTRVPLAVGGADAVVGHWERRTGRQFTGPVGAPSAQETRWLASRKQVGLFSSEPARFRLAPWRTVRQALGLGGVLDQSRNTEANPAQERPRTTDEPCQPVGTKGNQYVALSGAPVVATVTGKDGGDLDVTQSASGKLRIEYPLNEEPANPRGPSDLVRRHTVEHPDYPAGSVGASAPLFALSSNQLTGPAHDRREHTTSVDVPAPTVRAQDGTGHELVRVIGSGSNPRKPDAQYQRTFRDLTDEPCTTIVAMVGGGTGNAGPFVETRAASEPGRLDRPAPTLAGGGDGHICGRSIVSPSQRTREELLLALGRRRLSVAECATLMGFPENYPFQGTKTSKYKQVGNAVAPVVSQVVGVAVLSAHAEVQDHKD